MRPSVLLGALISFGLLPDSAAHAVIRPRVTENQKFIPADRQHYDLFGGALAVSGDTAIITAAQGGTTFTNNGSAYVYEFMGGAEPWTQTAELAPITPAAAYFGTSVDIDGDRAVIGAAGEAYVFERGLSGVWSQVAKLLAGDGSTSSSFGCDVAISGDQITVGAFDNPSATLGTGAAYIFTRSGLGAWGQTAKLTASNATTNALFGVSVGMDGDRVVVGAPGHGAGSNRPGAAYVFEKSAAGTWIEAAQLAGSNPADLDQFGLCVAINDDDVAVGAPRTRSGGVRTGSVQVFERSDLGQWAPFQRIDTDYANGDFGRAVAITDEHLLIGAEDHDFRGWNGAAYLYTNSAGPSWTPVKAMIGTGSVDGRFGQAVALDASAAFVGAPRFEFESGLAYYYDLEPVPEPSTVLLAATAIGCAVAPRRRR